MVATWTAPQNSPTLQYCTVPNTFVNPANDNNGFTKKIRSADTKTNYVDPLNPNASDSVFCRSEHGTDRYRL